MSIDVNFFISELRHSVTTASLNYDIWRVYNGEETRPKYIGVMNRYNLFFHTSLHAHFVALLIALYRIYETRKDTCNIPTLLQHLRDQEKIDPEEIECFYEIYDKAKPLWIKVSVLRNMAFGHRSNALTTAEIFQKAKVTPNELRNLVDLTKELLNAVSTVAIKNSHAFNLEATSPTVDLLENLGKM